MTFGFIRGRQSIAFKYFPRNLLFIHLPTNAWLFPSLPCLCSSGSSIHLNSKYAPLPALIQYHWSCHVIWAAPDFLHPPDSLPSDRRFPNSLTVSISGCSLFSCQSSLTCFYWLVCKCNQMRQQDFSWVISSMDRVQKYGVQYLWRPQLPHHHCVDARGIHPCATPMSDAVL